MIKSQSSISQQDWGEYFGCKACLFTLKNASGAFVQLTNYGATLVAAVVPDKVGNFENVVLGYSSLSDYMADECYLGATIGRFANRIGGAKFTLDGSVYHLDANDGINSNHSGKAGFNSRFFDYCITAGGVCFTLQSKDGDGGFPGNLELTVSYVWTDDNELKITYQATTDKKTVASFTNHAYFNLSAQGGGIFDHTLNIYADEVLDVDAAYIPTGLIKPAGDKALNGKLLRDKMMVGDNVIAGFNDCYLLQNDDTLTPQRAAILSENTTGRTLEIFTTYPSLMFYTGDYLHCEANGDFNRPYIPFDGLCMECQYYPDSPNHAHFPSTVLEPGKEYRENIAYKFGIAG